MDAARQPGILLLDKPCGLSSAGALSKVKKNLNLSKAGHCGTLDPDATGLLVILANEATRLADYIQDGAKIYSGILRLGVETESHDFSGKVLKTCDKIPEFAEVLASAEQFLGEIEQIPPQVSAIKVNGERAYELARKGEVFELKPRKVEVKKFDLSPRSREEVEYRIECSKGTYVRSLVRDLGAKLGCGACVQTLRREASFPFSARESKVLTEISIEDLLPWESAFPSLLRIPMEPAAVRLIQGGDQRPLLQIIPKETKSNSPLAIYEVEGSGQSIGLLSLESNRWKLAVNVVRTIG